VKNDTETVQAERKQGRRMSDIIELQRRIMAAMDRVASGLGELSGTGGGDAATQQALEDEKVVNAQLTERIRMLSQRHESDLAKLRETTEGTQAQLAKLDADLQKLRKANTQLSQSNQALRDANAAGVAEPHLINKAMLAELEALRAARAADISEANTIIAAMTPLLEEGATDPSAAEPEAKQGDA
jgi:chromosome segregation ATPase